MRGVPIDTTGNGVQDSVAMDTTADGTVDTIVKRADGGLVDTTGDGVMDSVAIASTASGKVDMIVSIDDYSMSQSPNARGSLASTIDSGGESCGSPLAMGLARRAVEVGLPLPRSPLLDRRATQGADVTLPDIFHSLHAIHMYKAYQRVRVLGRGTHGMAVLLRSSETGAMLVSKQLPVVGMGSAALEQVRNGSFSNSAVISNCN